MTGVPPVVLDAFLANFSLCDLILRLAEVPRLFEPKWSEEIIVEAVRTLESKLGWPGSLTAHLQAELHTHFREAWITGYQSLIPLKKNQRKDRHVAAAAVHGEAPVIVTFNLRHFRPENLEPWNVLAVHPQDFLSELFRQDAALVVMKLRQQAADRDRSLDQLLKILSGSVPVFTRLSQTFRF